MQADVILKDPPPMSLGLPSYAPDENRRIK